MSDVSVDIIKNRSGEAPDLPSGANLSGVSTAVDLQVTNLNPTHINASGVTTATTFSGSLKSTGTPTLGLGVTINSSGVAISGVATAGIVSATTLYGDGAALTGVAFSIAPISYTPLVNAGDIELTNIGIGITFTERIIAGSGNVTLRLVGAAGTVVENFGVGSSVTISNNQISITPTADLAVDTVYHLSYPSGAFTNTAGDVSYVGTAYTFDTRSLIPSLWQWGEDEKGQLGQNNLVNYSSPIQIPGTTWSKFFRGDNKGSSAIKTDGTLWYWGNNGYGQAGQNNTSDGYSSPTQVGSETTWVIADMGQDSHGIKTDGTLWAWGFNSNGNLGQNNIVQYSSPVQIPGTNWDDVNSGTYVASGQKSDNTLWMWGRNSNGQLAQNNTVQRSSPVQVPGTTWVQIEAWSGAVLASKTDGTLWSWGYGGKGNLAQNSQTEYSSPRQIPGTTWSTGRGKFGMTSSAGAIRTDGTLWMWGRNDRGSLGQNSRTYYSSPVQVPGTNWQYIFKGENNNLASKTDGTLWTWGQNDSGQLGHNNTQYLSSPVQIPGTWDLTNVYHGEGNPMVAFKDI